jgi:hypothetical protein
VPCTASPRSNRPPPARSVKDLGRIPGKAASPAPMLRRGPHPRWLAEGRVAAPGSGNRDLRRPFVPELDLQLEGRAHRAHWLVTGKRERWDRHEQGGYKACHQHDRYAFSRRAASCSPFEDTVLLPLWGGTKRRPCIHPQTATMARRRRQVDRAKKEGAQMGSF